MHAIPSKAPEAVQSDYKLTLARTNTANTQISCSVYTFLLLQHE